MGRPTIKTPEVIAKLKRCFELDYNIPDACFEANISQSTLYNWMKDDPDFMEEMTYTRGNVKRLAKRTLISKIEDNPQLAAWYLERKAKDEGYAQRTEVTGAEGVPLGYHYAADLPKPEEPKLLEDENRHSP
jgi:hypothetical protein